MLRRVAMGAVSRQLGKMLPGEDREFIEGHMLAAAAAAPALAAASAAGSGASAGVGACKGGAESAAADSPNIHTAAETGYLAQHRLFDQVPRLRGDVEVPAPVLEACAAPASTVERVVLNGMVQEGQTVLVLAGAPDRPSGASTDVLRIVRIS
jgi:hypothetical protein